MADTNNSNGAHLIDEEESYFVSMTDMMVGIIFIFVILLMTFALSFREAEKEREIKVEQLENVEKAKKEILTDIEQSLKEKGIEVKIDLENGILHLPEKILFASGSASINANGRESLGHLARALYAVVPCYSQLDGTHQKIDCSGRTEANLDAVFVEGHTDNVKIGRNSRFRDNWELSAQRAIETYKELINIEPLLDELRNENTQKLFSVSGYGEFRPRADNLTDEGKRANRRIDLRFLMKTPRSEDMEIIDNSVKEKVQSDGT